MQHSCGPNPPLAVCASHLVIALARWVLGVCQPVMRLESEAHYGQGLNMLSLMQLVCPKWPWQMRKLAKLMKLGKLVM